MVILDSLKEAAMSTTDVRREHASGDPERRERGYEARGTRHPGSDIDRAKKFPQPAGHAQKGGLTGKSSTKIKNADSGELGSGVQL